MKPVLTVESLSEEMLTPEIEGDTKGYLYILRMSEDRALAFLEQVRWPRGTACADCRSKDVQTTRNGDAGGETHECRRCRRRFGVRTGIAMGRVAVPILIWLRAIFLLCCTDRRLNVFQLARILCVDYQQARRVTQEIAAATGWTRSRTHIMFYSLEAAVAKVAKF